MVYGDFKDLPKRTNSDKIGGNKSFEIASNLHYDRYVHGLASTIYNFFDTKARETGTNT